MGAKIHFEDIIIHESNDFFIINKPPFFSSLDDRHEADSILSLAKNHSEQLQVCHRLDKETSGVMVIAKHAEAYRHMSMQFEHRKVEKIYHAIGEGIHDVEGIQIDVPLTPMNKGKVKIDFQEGKPSTTKVRTKQVFKRHTLFECKPVTGRMHQIRVHLAYLKAPLIMDTLYGGHELYLSSLKRNFNLKKLTEEEPLIKRVALHAYSIGFTDMNGESVMYEAEYHKDLRVLVKQLEKFV